MNKASYKQYDTRWSKLPYPTKKWTIGNSGCGEVSTCNTIIEMTNEANQTPKTIQPYCVQYAAPNGDGTYWSGIPAMMKHYGMTEVMEHDNMASLWKELAKGDRVAIYLMNNHPAGKKGVKWTTGGHFVSSVLFKISDDGRHWVYMKDPNSTSDLRNGWITYEDNMKGACLKVWSGKLIGALAKATAPASTVVDKELDACKTQANWMKNAKYGDWKPVTVEHSKTAGTCVTYVGCVLQRIGYLKSGQYIWHDGKGYGTGKVYGTNDKMTTTYMNNKTFKQLKSKLKAGDIVLCDDNKSGKSGDGGHIMIFDGKWSKDGNPYVWDVGKKMICERTGKHREYDGSHKILAIVRLKSAAKSETTSGAYTGSYPDVIRLGDEGTQVKRLQKYMNWFFGKDVVKVDGKYGEETQKYAKKMRVALGLKENEGKIGKAAFEKMKAYRK